MVDPRIKNTPVDSSSISGLLTDRAIELMGMLNKVIGTQDGLGNTSFTFLDDLGVEINQNLSAHTIERDVNDPSWQEKQVVYFGTTSDRLNLIQSTLNTNVEKIKSDIANNVAGLFDILNSKSAVLDDYEAAVANATNAQELADAEQALQDKITAEFTSDTALNTMIEEFFANIELTLSRMDKEIFDLLNDFDDDYSDGSTEDDAQKFLVTLPRRAGDTTARPSQIIDSIEEVLTLVLQENKEIKEAKSGAGTYTQADEDLFIRSQVLGSYANKSLKLDNDMMNAIITELGLTEDQAKNIKSSADLIKIVSPEKILELAGSVYGTSGNETATLKKLFTSHLDITTPKYYADQRSLFDILNGKAGIEDTSNKNVVFNSIGEQIKRVTNSTVDLFQYGYTKVTTNNLQETIRRSPLSAIEYLEGQKATASAEELESIQFLIDDLVDKQAQILEFTIDRESRNKSDPELIAKFQALFDAMDNYDPSKLEEIKTLFNNTGLNLPTIDAKNVDLSTFIKTADTTVNLPVVHNALYGNEMRESSEINARYDARKLPDFKQDGSAPEDDTLAPPTIGPSPLAGVIAKIGDTLLQKAYNLEKDTNIPTNAWLNDNVSMLKVVSDGFKKTEANPDSPMAIAFRNSLETNFRDIITDFFATNQPIKDAKDLAKSKYEESNAIKNDFDYLVRRGVIDDQTTIQDLHDLATELREQQTRSQREERILNAIDQVLTLENKLGDKVLASYTSLQTNNQNVYKDSIVAYSDSMTDFDVDMVETFKDSLDTLALDFDGNGVNDFIDITGLRDSDGNLIKDADGKIIQPGIMGRIEELSSNILSIYGDKGAVDGGIDKQGIRRLILLMFVFSMLEAGEWDARKNDADTTRYQVT